MSFDRGESPINIASLSTIMPISVEMDFLVSSHFTKVYYIVLNFESKEDYLNATKGGKTLVARCEALKYKVEELDELFHDIKDTIVVGVKDISLGPTNGDDDDGDDGGEHMVN